MNGQVIEADKEVELSFLIVYLFYEYHLVLGAAKFLRFGFQYNAERIWSETRVCVSDTLVSRIKRTKFIIKLQIPDESYTKRRPL